MPAVSEAQRRYLAAKFGSKWLRAHHFDNKGKLPKHVKPAKSLAEHMKRKGMM